MAVPAGTFTGYAAIGEREDLENIVYDISPTDTPFMSNVARGNASNTFHEWQTDVMATAASNAQVEGDDPSANTATPTVRLGNYTQIAWKVPRVTGTLRAVNTAGRSDELSFQTAKMAKELKRDVETGLLGLQAATAGAAASARVAAGVAAFLWNNQVQLGTGEATTPTVTSGAPLTAPTAASVGATVSEANLKSAISDCWDDGGEPTVVMCGSWNKKLISAFLGIATMYRESTGINPGTIVGAADLYISDFGSHQIVANRFIPAANIYVLDMEYWSVNYLRPFSQTDLSKTGDSDRKLILAEYTLTAKNPSSSAKIYTTTTS